MALRSGYKGFKKLLGLKTIRPGTLVVDDAVLSETFFPRSEQAVLGAKNLNGTVYTNKTTTEVTWTVNADGSVRAVNSSTLGDSRTDGESSTFVVPFNAQVKLSGGVDINHHIYPWDNTANSRPYTDSSKTTLQSNNADGNTIEFWMEKGHEYRMILRVNKNTQASDVTFYPMISLASDPDDTYAPYAMTNKELTEDRYYHAGDTVNVSIMNFSALVTGSSKEIRCTIPLMRDVSQITGFSFKNTTTIAVRKPTGGYLIDGLISGFTVTLLKASDNFLSFIIKKTDDTAFDATNNTPLDLAFTGGTNDSIITFS